MASIFCANSNITTLNVSYKATVSDIKAASANVDSLTVNKLYGSGNLVVSNSIATTNIFTSGYVGIGTSSPGAMLDVVSHEVPGSGSLIAQFGSTDAPRIKIYDENTLFGKSPYIYSYAGNGLGLASLGPILVYPGDTTNYKLRVDLDYTAIYNSLYVSATDGSSSADFCMTSFAPVANRIVSSTYSLQRYSFAVYDNNDDIGMSLEPHSMVNFSRTENNDDNNFHLELVNTSQSGDYGVGLGFLDTGNPLSAGQSPFIISPHKTAENIGRSFTGSSTESDIALSIATDGSKNIGINSVPKAGVRFYISSANSDSSSFEIYTHQVDRQSLSNIIYSAQICDNNLLFEPPLMGGYDGKSPAAMVILNRDTNNGFPYDHDPAPLFHMEFTSNNIYTGDISGVGFGFNSYTLNHPCFIIAPHSYSSFDTSSGDQGNEPIAIYIRTDKSGYVGIQGYPEYHLDVQGTTRSTEGIISNGSILATNSRAVNVNSSNNGVIYSGTQDNGSYWNGTNFPSDGVVLFGHNDGSLGTTNGGQTNILTWDYSGNVQVYGNLTVNGSLITGGVVSGKATSYTVQNSDYYVGINGTAVTVTLPNTGLVPGKSYFIKDESGNAGRNPITLSGNGNMIDGSATITMKSNYISLQVIWAGSFWSII